MAPIDASLDLNSPAIYIRPTQRQDLARAHTLNHSKPGNYLFPQVQGIDVLNNFVYGERAKLSAFPAMLGDGQGSRRVSERNPVGHGQLVNRIQEPSQMTNYAG